MICERTPDLPRFVRTDGMKFRQVLINLLNNAVRFTESGSVTLRAGMIPGTRTAKNGEHLLTFEVEDTGPGIASDEHAALFEPFSQTRTGRDSQGGTGLGLAISREFIRLMGGDLTVGSQGSGGATFVFDIRAEVAEREEADDADHRRQVIAPATWPTPVPHSDCG